MLSYSSLDIFKPAIAIYLLCWNWKPPPLSLFFKLPDILSSHVKICIHLHGAQLPLKAGFHTVASALEPRRHRSHPSLNWKSQQPREGFKIKGITHYIHLKMVVSPLVSAETTRPGWCRGVRGSTRVTVKYPVLCLKSPRYEEERGAASP